MAIRILYINKNISGPMEALARHMAKEHGCVSVFMAERWPREKQIAGCTLVRLPAVKTPAPPSVKKGALQQGTKNMLLRNAINAVNVKAICSRLRMAGFVPDVVYVSAQEGYGVEVQSVFPKARIIVRLDWLYQRPKTAEHNHIYNTFQLSCLSVCSRGIAAFQWQKMHIDKVFSEKICIIKNGVDTNFFVPPLRKGTREVINFSCQGASPARGFGVISQCLPQVLSLRPKSKINIISFAARKTEAGKAQHIKDLTGLLAPLSKDEQKRVTIIPSPSPEEYRTLLQQSTLYVYLSVSNLFSAGILEAMSCGALVLASSTDLLREVITHGKDGLLWEGGNAQSLAFEIASACAGTKNLRPLRRAARQAILANHDLLSILRQQAAVLLGDECPNAL